MPIVVFDTTGVSESEVNTLRPRVEEDELLVSARRRVKLDAQTKIGDVAGLCDCARHMELILILVTRQRR